MAIINVIVLNQAAYNYINNKKSNQTIATYLIKKNIEIVPIAIKDTVGGNKRWILTHDMFTRNEWKYLKDIIASESLSGYITPTTLNDSQLIPPFTPITNG